MTLYEQNMQKIQELDVKCQYAAHQWMQECWQLNKQFRILEAFRTQKRQEDLYAKGRTTSGNIVTWTKISMHTKRLAVDVEPIRCTLQQLESIGREYGIYRPPDLVKLGDQGHFQFDQAVGPPQISPTEAKRRLLRMINLESDPQTRKRLLKRLI